MPLLSPVGIYYEKKPNRLEAKLRQLLCQEHLSIRPSETDTNGTAMNVREIALDVCKALSTLAFSAAIVWVIWSGHQTEKENPEKPFDEGIDSIAADARATAENALAYADSKDLTDTGPGALERIRAARLVAIDLNLAAKRKTMRGNPTHWMERNIKEIWLAIETHTNEGST
jgi:hypothetical protein